MKLGIYLYTNPISGIPPYYILLIGKNKYNTYEYIDLTTKYLNWFQPRSIMANNLKLIHECDPNKAIDLYPEYFI